MARCKFYVWFIIFFFQAEDGIRDYKVTGVQTCALPISAFGQRVLQQHGDLGGTLLCRRQHFFPGQRPDDESSAFGNCLLRSEERRVGKECTALWCPGLGKKDKPSRC